MGQMLQNLKPEELSREGSKLLETLWGMTHPQDQPLSVIEGPALVEITMATVELKGLNLQLQGRGVELVWEVKIRGEV
jgi:hypothetical protein